MERLVIDNIKRIRKEKGISQEKLAEACNTATSYIGLMEIYKNVPKLSTIERIAKALNVSVEFLLFGDATNNDDVYRKLHDIFYDCGEAEYNIIMDTVLGTAMAVKKSLRTNKLNCSPT